MKNRDKMVKSLVEVIYLSETLSKAPGLTERDRDAMADRTLETIGKIVDEIYKQGYMDGGTYATEVAKSIIEESRF